MVVKSSAFLFTSVLSPNTAGIMFAYFLGRTLDFKVNFWLSCSQMYCVRTMQSTENLKFPV